MTDPDPLFVRLAEANPVRPEDVQGAAHSPTADLLLSEITDVRHARSVGQARADTRRRWIVVATVLLVAILSITVLLQRTSEAPASASEVLLRTAAVAASRSSAPGEGAYVYTKIDDEQLRTSSEGGAKWSVALPAVQEMWVAPDGSGRLRSVAGEPRFLGPRDRALWEAAGSPELPAGITDTPFSPGALPYEDVAALPTEARALEEELRAEVASEGLPGSVGTFLRIGELLARDDASPALRAALYRLTSRLPGVSLVGDRTDLSGRSGEAVGMTYEASGARVQVLMIFDEETSALLAQERVLLERASWVDAAPGTRLSFVAYLASGRVDSVQEVVPVG